MAKIKSWKRGCTLKKRYSDLFFAEGVAEKRSKLSNVKLSTYKCVHCTFWHITKEQREVTEFKILKVVSQ